MVWNWQLADWTQFAFDQVRLVDAEARFLKGAGVVVGSMHHLDGETRQGLVIELISQETIDSSAIEREVLDRVSVQSSIARQLGFAADKHRSIPAEAGVAELMADLYRRYAEPLTDQLLFDWHAMLMNGRRDVADVGAYRTHANRVRHASCAARPFPVRSRTCRDGAVHCVVQRQRPRGRNALAGDNAAAIAHLWFETIHPFEDGNGRLGRAIAEKVLNHWTHVR